MTCEVDFSEISSVTITHYPNPALLAAQLRALPPKMRKIVVDNGSPASIWSEVESLIENVRNVEVLRLEENVGLAEATNVGAEHIQRAGSTKRLLILDQDSEPMPGSVGRLNAAFLALLKEGAQIGAVGPTLIDPVTQRRHGFHVIDGWRWRRIDPETGPPVDCSSLNGSGTLVDFSLFMRLGGLDSSFFIDHVDTEWSFRMMAKGWSAFGVPESIFIHRMGDSSTRIWLGAWRVWPIRSPLRHEYLYRNAVRLIRKPYVPLVWKVWAVPKLLLTSVVFGMCGPERTKQLIAMARGIRLGLFWSA